MYIYIFLNVYIYICNMYIYIHICLSFTETSCFFLSGMQRRVCRGATHVLQMGQEELLRAGAAGDGKISGSIGMLLFYNYSIIV